MPYLKEAHISSSPVIDGLITISHNGHSLAQITRAGIAGEGIQQPVLSMRYILELIQLHPKRVMIKLGKNTSSMLSMTQTGYVFLLPSVSWQEAPEAAAWSKTCQGQTQQAASPSNALAIE